MLSGCKTFYWPRIDATRISCKGSVSLRIDYIKYLQVEGFYYWKERENLVQLVESKSKVYLDSKVSPPGGGLKPLTLSRTQQMLYCYNDYSRTWSRRVLSVNITHKYGWLKSSSSKMK